MYKRSPASSSSRQPPKSASHFGSASSSSAASAQQLRLVALNYPRTGNLHGVLGVDYQCYRQAKQARLKGTFRGLLVSRGGGGVEASAGGARDGVVSSNQKAMLSQYVRTERKSDGLPFLM